MGIENCNLLKTLKEIRYLFLGQRLDILHSERLVSHLHPRLRPGLTKGSFKALQGKCQVISMQIYISPSLSQRVFKTKKSSIVKTKEFSSFENGPKSVVHYSVSRLPNAQNAHFLFLGQCPKVPKSAQSAQKTTTENKIGISLTYGCLYVFPVLSLFGE